MVMSLRSLHNYRPHDIDLCHRVILHCQKLSRFRFLLQDREEAQQTMHVPNKSRLCPWSPVTFVNLAIETKSRGETGNDWQT